MSSPWNLITIQVLVGAFAVGMFVYVVSQRHPVLAAITGFLLAIGGAWANYHRIILTESLYTSMYIISFTAVLYHYQSRGNLTSWALIPAGVLYGVTALVRPSGLYYVFVIIIAYMIFITTWRKTALILLGVGLVYTGNAYFMYTASDSVILLPEWKL